MKPGDFVRIEIAEALARDIPVVPVLLDGAPMPEPGQLPDELKELVYRHAEFVEYTRFDDDVARLSKYPPAEPGALSLEPPEAVDGVADAAPKSCAT